jgi:hypothetical protein
MAKRMEQVEIEGSGKDVIDHAVKLYQAVKAAGAFSAAAIPADVAALVAEMPAIVAAAGSIPGDLKEDKVEFAKGVLLGAFDLYDAVK